MMQHAYRHTHTRRQTILGLHGLCCREGAPAEQWHERQQVCRQRPHVQGHLHVQDVIGEQVVIQQCRSLGLLQGCGNGGGLLGDV